MSIISTLLAPEDGVALLVMDTLVDGKSIVTTLVVGDLRKDKISSVGSQCISRASAHHKANYPDGKVLMIEIRVASQVETRLPAALRDSNQGDLLVFVCRTSELYDMVFPHLCLQHGPAGFDRM